MSNILEREKLAKAYESVMVNESKTGMRRKLQLLDDSIDEFMDMLEKKTSSIDDNPVFQRKVFQMIADATKEHAEFVASMKRVAATLDSGAQIIPKTKTSMQFKRSINPYDAGEEGGEIAPNELPPPAPPGSQSPSNEALLEAVSLQNVQIMRKAMDKIQKAVEDQVSRFSGKDLATGASLATDLENLKKKYLATLVRIQEMSK